MEYPCGRDGVCGDYIGWGPHDLLYWESSRLDQLVMDVVAMLRQRADMYESGGEPGPLGYNCWGWRSIAENIRGVADKVEKEVARGAVGENEEKGQGNRRYGVLADAQGCLSICVKDERKGIVEFHHVGETEKARDAVNMYLMESLVHDGIDKVRLDELHWQLACWLHAHFEIKLRDRKV